jgi:hypothetical protein
VRETSENSFCKQQGAYFHTDADDIELEASLQELFLDLLGDAVETNVASGENRIALRHSHSHLEFEG